VNISDGNCTAFKHKIY